ncbi:MAG: SoxR reducing system RseC family protein [Psychromonas sp.]|nr:SoxR reducing system RseC family protein [Psychromonas sp.]
MIRETGKIIAIEKQHEKTIAVVECISKSACSSCHQGSSCGVGVVAKTFSDKTHQFEIPYKDGMQVDEFIDIQINNRDLIKSASVAYLIPLLFLIVGALLAKQFLFVSEGMLIVIAVGSAAIGFAVTRFISNKFFSKEQLSSVIKSNSSK